MHGNSRMAIIKSRSLVYTKVQPPPNDQYRIPTDTCIDNTQNPMSTIRSCIHVPKTLRGTSQPPGKYQILNKSLYANYRYKLGGEFI